MARQLAKQQRRTVRSKDSGEVATPLQDPPVDSRDPTLHGAT
jgi:hypothetical protein